MRNIKIIIEYDGTNYSGWQRQNNVMTIQEKIESAIEELTGEKTQITGSSRTDAGVHAKGYTGNFYTNSKIVIEKFTGAINSKLPRDIVILQSFEVPYEFHSRYNSMGKMYSYTIINRRQAVAVGRDYIYHHKQILDVEAMQIGAQYFMGTHDFSAFKNLGSSAKTSVRTISRLDIVKNEELIKIYIAADGFLYNMVRIIVGALIRVGEGKIKPSEIKDIIESKQRSKAGKSVPANGLCLEEVFY
ncbi:tRNA pseudouridine(38-40) synthase TruA [Clostridium estertheticum]|uniref:tRNA pseudouridine(38-40) synthase TruA n=1 Tax=Clostridium estertheticum TaxID=238834 RepID=UPI001C0B2599|nr:tRNA pseudouridine(38-40) synthase TruA [Clostridium estertheticum]MBU3073585.1 tRNA pseudouridine(38-40) synthase TruA [Clostridium estertheticum]MBU3163678.1 tRNA pseudouridine(38-40) synthase TruA [Clostridium estertheticum]MBU3172175.1 tRNA pseudouridine(38-40) synthase TruA [Clostridium estertheticum]MCB2353117.1 tRNA pseudouridine(38-40) synthase TruA [Clostridium estertheticum]WAG41475.1 tRNA pseudouridine(38-40) synthase TruA [Clostridium estertheticum]